MGGEEEEGHADEVGRCCCCPLEEGEEEDDEDESDVREATGESAACTGDKDAFPEAAAEEFDK